MTTYIPTTDPVPDGYRFATAEEAEFYTTHGFVSLGHDLWVKVGHYPETDIDTWDLVVPVDFVLDGPTCPPTLVTGFHNPENDAPK